MTDHDPIELEDALPEGPSKTRRKKDSDALQHLGAELVALSADRLKKVPLPENLRDAVRACQRFKMEARRRQLQYIGKLMRTIDVEPIQAMLDVFNGVSAEEIARQHRLERQRDRLLEDEAMLFELAERHPGVDLQRLRVLRRNALKEREAQKPPRAFREIFRILREIDESTKDE